MSNGGGMLDSLGGIFSSSGGGSRGGEEGDRDPRAARLERVEQIATGVRMAAAALDEDMKGLRREAGEAADAVLEAARSLADEGPGEEGAATGSGRRRGGTLESLDRCVQALEELHYDLVRIEVHPDVQSGDERERAAERTRASVEEARELAESLSETAAA